MRTACSRSLCTCNFAKSVHFWLRLAVYHPYFDCLDHTFTVYLPFFVCSRRSNAETALGGREAAKKLADTLSLTQAERRPGTADRTRAVAASGAGARDGGSSRSYRPNGWIAQAAARVAARAAAGSGCPGRLGLKRLGRLADRRSGVDGSGGAARMAQLTDDGNGSPNSHTCLVRVKVRVKGRRSVARGRGAGHVRQGEGSSRRCESSGSGGGG